MADITARTYLTGFTGGPCPSCGLEGELREVHSLVTLGTRVIVHGDSAHAAVACTMPLRSGTLFTTPDGTWYYDPSQPGTH